MHPNALELALLVLTVLVGPLVLVLLWDWALRDPGLPVERRVAALERIHRRAKEEQA